MNGIVSQKYLRCLLLLMPLLFGGCVMDEGVLQQGEGVSLSIGNVLLKQEKTRATSTVTSGSIGVFRSGAEYLDMNNVEYTYNGGWSSINPIGLSKSTASVCAYYPFSASNTNSAAIPLTSQLYSASADVSYATAQSITSTNPNVDFAMSRAYAKITFNITNNLDAGACAISNISIGNLGLSTSCTLDMHTGILSNKVNGVVSVNPAIASIASGSTTTVKILMVPVTTAMNATVIFSFTIDGVNYSTELPASKLPTLIAGMNYVVNVPVSEKGFGLELADVETQNGTSFMSCMANCYIVSPGSSITIPVNLKGNGDPYTARLAGLSVTHVASSVGVFWNTYPLYITTSFDKTSQTATITVGSAEGNAVIAAYDTDGTILWSWHIWVTDVPAEETNNGYSWMDRNLGATARASNTADTTFATCGGLFYQWGRKDPSLGTNGLKWGTYAYDAPILPSYAYNLNNAWRREFLYSSGLADIGCITRPEDDPIPYTDQCAYSIKYPLLFICYWAGSTATEAAAYTTAGGKDSWGGEFGQSKSIFDPCPFGWRVPSARKSSSALVSPWSTWIKGSFSASTYSATKWDVSGAYYYPSAGCRDRIYGHFTNIGVVGDYWSATAPSKANAYYLGISSNYTVPSSENSRDYGFSVRCVREW